MENDLLAKIGEAKAKFLDPEDQRTISGWEEQAKRHLITTSLKGHKGVEMILANYRKDISEMNALLLNAKSKDMSDLERDRILDRRAMYEKFVRIFDDAEKAIANIEKDIESRVE
jgi:hypothetical protein